MTNDHTEEVQVIAAGDIASEDYEDEYETAAEYHRMAARHFSAAAKHHLAAATADDEGDNDTTARHAFQAYRHQLNGVQYAEIAVMDNEGLADDLDDVGDDTADKS